MNKSKKDIPIEFIATVPGLIGDRDAYPRPTREFIPDWWRTPKVTDPLTSLHTGLKTNVRSCPSFPEYFSQGYVLPMWADTTLQFDKATGNWSWRCGRDGSPYIIDIHPNDQFLDYAPAKMQGVDVDFLFKLISPWRLKTPKGYSVLQLPMFYHFNQDFSVLPGIIATDMHHELNQQVAYHGKGEEIFIPKGTPLVQYIPFKRDSSFEMTVREKTIEDQKTFDTQLLRLTSRFLGSGAYKKHKKNLDNN